MTDKYHLYRRLFFGTTWGWINEYIFTFGWTFPSRQQCWFLLKANSCGMRAVTFKRRGYMKLPKTGYFLSCYCEMKWSRLRSIRGFDLLNRDREDNSKGHMCRDVPVPDSVKSLMSFFLQMLSTYFKYSFFSDAFLCGFICELQAAEQKETCLKQQPNAGGWCVYYRRDTNEVVASIFCLRLICSHTLDLCWNNTVNKQTGLYIHS